jgi:glycosyltransferase involved in cell wall biosynthesis
LNSENQKNKTQILYVWDYLDWGGVQIYFFALMRQVAIKYNVKAIIPKLSSEKLISYLKINNFDYDFFDGNKDSNLLKNSFDKILRRLRNLNCNFQLAKKLSKEDLKNSIIQIDITPWSNFALLLYLLLRTKVFVTFHTALPKISGITSLYWKIKFRLLAFSNNFHVAVSNLEVKESLRSFLPTNKFDAIRLVYSGYNNIEIENILQSSIERDEIATKHNLPLDKFFICNVGQFIDRKGCWFLLDALQELKKTQLDIFFYWLGTSNLDNETRLKIDSYDLGESFRFLSADEIGNSRSDLLNLVKFADLFVMPSLEEGLPIGLVEAMALRKAIIVSNINAIPEAIEHLENGFLIPPKDSSKIAEAIKELKFDTELRNKLGLNAQITAFEKFDEQKNGEAMLEFYESVS